MATPTKRRKTNGFKSSPKTVGSLEFFFGKQKEEKAESATNKDGLQEELDNAAPTLDHEKAFHDVTAQALADEQLARKLQLEWDSEARANGQAQQLNAEASSLPTRESEDSEWKPRAESERLSPITSPKKAYRNAEEKETETTAPNIPETLRLQSALTSKDTISSSIPFDESPLKFDPSRYLPELRRHWDSEGGHASYGLLTRCFILVNATQSRIKIVDTLVNFLRTIIEGDPDTLLPAVSVLSVLMGDFRSNNKRYDTIGLVGYECDIPAVHIIRAWPRRLRNFQSSEKNVWFR